MNPVDLAAVEAHVKAIEDDDLANIPEDIADNVDQVCADVKALVAELRWHRGTR